MHSSIYAIIPVVDPQPNAGYTTATIYTGLTVQASGFRLQKGMDGSGRLVKLSMKMHNFDRESSCTAFCLVYPAPQQQEAYLQAKHVAQDSGRVCIRWKGRGRGR